MAWLRRAGAATPPEADAPPALPPDVEHIAPGLKQAIERLPRPGASVLDLGPALAANITFFRRLQARVRVLDFESTLRESSLWEQPKKLPLWEKELVAALALDPDERFGLILAWDFPNYLGRERWPVVARLLVARLAPGGMVHQLARSGHVMPAQPGHFRITAAETIREEVRSPDNLEPPRFSHGEVERLNPGLAAARSFLDKHGIQEFLLEHAGELNLPPRPIAQPRKPRSYYPG